MSKVVNQVGIVGPIDRVFNIVTTTRYWPQWHPATLAVGGVTDRPIALGDVIHERAQIGGREYEGDWTVDEHVRPSRVVLQVEGGRIQITYAFAAEGETTNFRRELEFQPADFIGSAADPSALEGLMYRQSEEGLQKLKLLVEELLATGGPAIG